MMLGDLSLYCFDHLEFRGNGTRIQWSMFDEDLTLKGFWQDELRNVVARGKM